MPVANVRSKWSAGNLIFYESVAGNGAYVQFGEDASGMDMKFFGATAGNYMLWDESADSLLLVGTAVKFSLGSFTGAAIGTGSVVSSSTTAPFKVFADDGGLAIGSGSLVRAGWFRNLQTYTGGNREQEACGVQGSLVSVAGTNRHNMCGVLGSWEARTSIIVGGQAASTDVWVQAGVIGRVGMSAGTFNVDTNARLCGLAAMSNVSTTCTETFTGVYAGLYVGKWASTNSWTHGIYIEPSAVGKAIQVGELSSTVSGSGVALTDSVTRVMEVHADDANTARTSGKQGRAIFGRTMIYANTAQENWGLDGLVKWSGVVKTANVDAGVVGRFEAIGTCQTSTGTGNTFCAGVMGRIGSATTGFTIDSGTWVAGVLAFYNTSVTNAFGTGSTAAFMATASDLAGTGDWDYGLYIEDAADGIYISAAATGISLPACTTAGINISGGTAAGSAILVGTSTTGVQVDGTPDYAVEVYADVPTGAISLTNVGAFNCRTTIAAASDITSNSYTVASYNRLEIEGGSTDLGFGWYNAVLAYLKNPSGSVDATNSAVGALMGLINVGADWDAQSEAINAAVIAGTYSPDTADIRRYYGFYVWKGSTLAFTHGLYAEAASCTTVIGVGGATNLLSLPAAAPWSATNASGDAGKIAILINGATKYINAYNS